MNTLQKITAIGMLIFAIGFNLRLYEKERSITIDPNDNAFQYALVERTNQVWDWASTICPKNLSYVPCHLSYLTDHWVPNWAQGYNLPFYYSHVPQIVIVGTYKIYSSVISFLPSTTQDLRSTISLFQYYHTIVYLLLCFFPLSLFLSLRILRLPWLTAGIGALIASHISTDGLYGIDQSSFLWRGWGLSSQLFAITFMPLAIAFSIRFIVHSSWFMENTTMHTPSIIGIGKQFFKELKICVQNILRKTRTANLHLAKEKDNRNTDTTDQASLKNSLSNSKWIDIYAILFITLTTMGHLGLGLMVFMSIPVIAFTKPLVQFLSHHPISSIWKSIQTSIIQIVLLAVPPLILLSYWIVPTLLQSAYHNISFWDPIWKFNSYGAMEVLTNLFNGALFDFGRLPMFTGLVFIGLFACLQTTNKNNSSFEKDKTGETNACWEQTKFCAASLPLKDRMYGKNEVGTEDASEFSFATNACNEQHIYLFPLSLLFLFFLLLYFGTTTWGTILHLIPSMNEFHQHRFIVGVHLMGLFLAPIGIQYLVYYIWQSGTKLLKIASRAFQFQHTNKEKIESHGNGPTNTSLLRAADQNNFRYALSQIGITAIVVAILIPLLYRQTVAYSTYNDTLITQSNAMYTIQKKDADLLIKTLKALPPGRVFAGRGGTWGKDFQVADTPYFMHLSTYGIPTVLWLPETWSNNSDTEQYFSENTPDHYELYNIRYVVTPSTASAEPFWRLIQESPSWKLYEVSPSTNLPTSPAVAGQMSAKEGLPTSPSSSGGYITVGTSPSIVFSDKISFANAVRLWIQSPYPGKKLFPQLILSNKNLASKGQALQSYFQLPQFTMIDEATYKTSDGKTHTLFGNQPVYMNPWEWPQAFPQYQLPTEAIKKSKTAPISILSQSSDTDMIFRATVQISPSTNPPTSPSSSSCPTCVVVLKQTYHPNWKTTVRKINNQDGEPADSPHLPISLSTYLPINVFPSYVAIRLEEPGTYEVVFSYTPSRLKIILLFIGIISACVALVALYRFNLKHV